MNYTVNIQGLSKSFKQQEVLVNVNLNIEKGSLVHIKGDNGSGKSTLLYIIAGLLSADEGTVSLESDAYIGALIENPEFADYSTIEENLKYLGKLKNNYNEKVVKELCKLFSLDFKSKKPIKKYSVGMRQKVGIIQALMENQNLLLMDEPTRGLDDVSRSNFTDLINQKVSNGNATVIITSHEEIKELNYTHKYLLSNGNLHEI